MNDFEIDSLLTAIFIFAGLGFLAVMRSHQSDNRSAASTTPAAPVEEDAEKTATLVEPLNQHLIQRSDQQSDDSVNDDRANSSNAGIGNSSNLKAIDQPDPEEATEVSSNLTVTRDIKLSQDNPLLVQLITQWIGEDWLTQPQELKQLELLMQNTQFCSDWWQVRRTIKQSLAHTIRQQTGIEINIHSLFDVHAVSISVQQRQLLNLLHVLTLYVRLKINATTDTVQHFTHRSIPRTCIFAGQVRADDPIAASIAQLMQAAADTINNDPEVQGKLQVIVLIANYSASEQFQLMRQLRAAADLAQYIPLARQTPAQRTPLLFAVNGATLLGSRHSSNLELQQILGAKHCFLFGKTETEVSDLQNQGYDPLSEYSSNLELRQVIDPIASGYFSYGDTHAFQDLGNWLLSQDPALVLADYSSYMDCQERVSQSYQDQKHWTRLSILTTARAGQFLSTHTP